MSLICLLEQVDEIDLHFFGVGFLFRPTFVGGKLWLLKIKVSCPKLMDILYSRVSLAWQSKNKQKKRSN